VNNLKPWLQFADVRADQIGPANPLGLFSDHRRLDTDKGIELFLQNWMAPAAALGVEGVIFWALYHAKRGAMYRPDGHMLPPEIEKRWPRLMKGLEQLGMRAGVCIRPQHVVANCGTYDMAVRAGYDQHNPAIVHYAKHVAGVWVDRGVRHFYADSFGENWWHKDILQAIQSAGALKVWMEASCGATLLAGGSIYCENPKQGPWNTPEEVTAARRANPNLDVLCNPRAWKTTASQSPTGYVDVVRMGYRPLIQDYQLATANQGKSDAVEACKLIQAMSRPKRDEGETKATKGVLP
jgi:hypothetical protein